MKKYSKIWFAIVFLFLWQVLLVANEKFLVITPKENWSAIFGGQRATFHFTVSSKKPLSGRVGWRFSIGKRTLARSESQISLKSFQKQTIKITISIPSRKTRYCNVGKLIPKNLQKPTKNANCIAKTLIYLFY